MSAQGHLNFQYMVYFHRLTLIIAIVQIFPYHTKQTRPFVTVAIDRGTGRLAPVSDVNFFSKTDALSKIAIYKLYLEVEVLGLDISKFDYQRG